MRETHILQPRPPFSFDLALAFLRRFPPTMGDRIVDGERVLGAARVDGQTIGFQVGGLGDVESPALRCTLDVGRDTGGTRADGLDPTRIADAPLPLGTAQSFDRELLQAGRAVYGADLTVDGLAEIAERYGLHRGSWGHYLRIAD
jgi:hypothetical protein